MLAVFSWFYFYTRIHGQKEGSPFNPGIFRTVKEEIERTFHASRNATGSSASDVSRPRVFNLRLKKPYCVSKRIHRCFEVTVITFKCASWPCYSVIVDRPRFIALESIWFISLFFLLYFTCKCSTSQNIQFSCFRKPSFEYVSFTHRFRLKTFHSDANHWI